MTVVPYLPPIVFSTAVPLEQAIILLATIHVPMTGYLLFDPEIRAMMRRHPVNLILGPIAVFAIGAGGFALLRGSGNWSIILFMMSVLSWNMWHFGKQNVGVYSFMRATELLSPMVPIERKMIVVGSVFGVLSAIYGLKVLTPQAPDVDFSVPLAVIAALRPATAIAGLILFALSLLHVFRDRARMTWSSAVIFIFSVNFFLPSFLDAISVPTLFALTTFAHGCQYVVFLLFHAAGYRGGGRWATAGMLLALGAGLLITSDLYHFHWSGYDVAPGVAMGILLMHFWFDQTIWRLKEPESRRWVQKRFAFLFSK